MTSEAAPPAGPSEPDLTFQGPVEKGFPFVLFLCVAGSLFAHTATFFLFQVVYPQRVTILQPAPHVSLITPSSPENIALLRWVEAEDPALIARDNAVTPPALAQVQYRPSFMTPRGTPAGAPVERVKDVAFPPAMDRIEVTPPGAGLAAAVSPMPSVSTMRFAGALAGRSLTKNPPLPAPRLAADPVQPTVLLIGVDAQGEIRFPVLQAPCGNSDLDNLAIEHLRQINFAPADEAITWGHVTFAWGADAYSEAAGFQVPPSRGKQQAR